MPLLGSAVEFPRSAVTQLAHFSTQLAAFVGGLLLYAYAFKTADIQELGCSGHRPLKKIVEKNFFVHHRSCRGH